MARRLLEAQSGGVEASNNPGGGASFTFWLPTFEADDAEDPAG
jgi:signal transduction histidine kinase